MTCKAILCSACLVSRGSGLAIRVLTHGRLYVSRPWHPAECFLPKQRPKGNSSPTHDKHENGHETNVWRWDKKTSQGVGCNLVAYFFWLPSPCGDCRSQQSIQTTAAGTEMHAFGTRGASLELRPTDLSQIYSQRKEGFRMDHFFET